MIQRLFVYVRFRWRIAIKPDVCALRYQSVEVTTIISRYYAYARAVYSCAKPSENAMIICFARTLSAGTGLFLIYIYICVCVCAIVISISANASLNFRLLFADRLTALCTIYCAGENELSTRLNQLFRCFLFKTTHVYSVKRSQFLRLVWGYNM